MFEVMWVTLLVRSDMIITLLVRTGNEFWFVVSSSQGIRNNKGIRKLNLTWENSQIILIFFFYF